MPKQFLTVPPLQYLPNQLFGGGKPLSEKRVLIIPLKIPFAKFREKGGCVNFAFIHPSSNFFLMVFLISIILCAYSDPFRTPIPIHSGQ